MGFLIFLLVMLGLGVIGITIASMWILFNKAGQPGWAAIVPVYNLIVWLKVCRKPIWWLVFLLIPYVNIVFNIILQVRTAIVFGKSGGFAVGMALVSFVFFPILAFGNAKYVQEEETPIVVEI